MSTLTRADVEALIQEARDSFQCLDLVERDLSGLDLSSFNLQGAYLRGSNLRGTDLRWANLEEARWDGLAIQSIPSGRVYLIPTPDGWYMHVGCWKGAPDELRRLIAQDEDWPEAEGEEITRRRPYLEAALALCEAHMADHADVIDKLRERWGSADEEAAA
ncbi:pentapeptide repeat-containing protein [Corynebacterium mastitidis]|uniref:Pentapeptide repeat-containing protein n=1 Tax=Corynebacterium mastitidis TaxID=161890 RepID=A0A2N0X911_9CORY|nr:pentapeptide repeat-containing protein [Corynebacterium mastitidis]MCH6197465.1 pentapeptide repeat-containing protein [Corynebacterium mastitidis]PKF69206.1 pentapeptide repeat-containing protein [Corynebacterium mastitidis]